MAALAALDVVVVASAGNSYFFYQAEGADYPASDPNVIAVGAVFSEDAIAWLAELGVTPSTAFDPAPEQRAHPTPAT